MICVMCNRYMLTAAIMLGGYPVGPKCAKKRGLLDKQKSKKSKAERDDKTINLFERDDDDTKRTGNPPGRAIG
jgi:hypothetical protein